MQSQDIFSEINKQKDAMARTLKDLIRIPAIAPENGGEGESRKAEKLMQTLKTIGFDNIERFDAEDERVPSEVRPNIVASCRGKGRGRLWIVTHLDVVPPGEESLWTITKPFEPKIKNGRIYGRGSEDNGQSMIASIFAIKALRSLGIKPERTMMLAFVADEEQGSTYGIQHLVKQKLFKKNDLIVVPDSGNEDGSFIEVAEKSGLWFKIRTIGKQTHASRPGTGLNAHRVGMDFASELDKVLHEKYSSKDQFFDPPESTFEPTKKEKNVDAVNIIPGEDIVHFDCRILPTYNLDDILETAHGLAEEYNRKTGAKIEIKTLHKSVAPKPTEADSETVTMLKRAIKQVREIEPRVGGIGGGTCAAFFRRADIPAVVWSTIDEMAHQPNEYAKMGNLVKDAKVFASMAIS